MAFDPPEDCFEPATVQRLLSFVPSTLKFQNINYTVDGKTVLNNVSGKFKHGRLVALMGPSGAGKSSLMNVLAGMRMFGLDGQITINEKPVEENDPRSVYVEQDCPLLSYLTVRGTMTYAVDMKMSRKTTAKEKKNKIKEILEMLGLDKCASTLVKDISGGEQKRLSVAVELITNPAVMLLDEPTSGLDSVSSLQLVSHLKSLAMGGRTIVCSIHQPASNLFQLFDDVLLLVRGRCLYSGSVSGMVPTLESAGFVCPEYYNPADFAIEVMTSDAEEAKKTLIDRTSEELRELFEGPTSSPTIGRSENVRTGRYQIPFWYQFMILLKRSAISTTRDEFFLKIRVGLTIALGPVFGIIYYNAGNDASKVVANIGMYFQLFAFNYFPNAIAMINYTEEANVAVKEISNNWYSREAYFLSKLLNDVPLQLLCPTLLLPPIYYLTDQPLDPTRFAMVWAMFFLGGAIAQCIGLLAGICFSTKTQNFIVANACLIPSIFSGFLINERDLLTALKPFSIVSFYRYQFHGVMQALYGLDRDPLKCSQVYCYFKKPTVILETFDVDPDGFWLCIGILVALLVFFQVSIYLAFVVRLRKIKI
ncbi:ATP-binding cassette sub-family G member 1-like [Uranotaenia lowii]|uniref:ATP-binding cassette sub-family G member 1-like n=1 Tax=Uranotaenia lowii TaxID=190385 RepID=UPI00247ABF4E|nr:ATP-binding cassette sub-family G member 1-like [Uranotaenia lowii]XP_055598772.1 ATP-binding cassette sub-family G member 1-like [Uranotaenia lowii]